MGDCRMSLPILVCVEASSTFRVKAKKFSHSIFNDSRPENRNFAFLTILTYSIFTIWLQLFWFIVSVLHFWWFWQFLRRQELWELVCELWNVKGERDDFMITKCRMRVVRPSWEGGGVWNTGKRRVQGFHWYFTVFHWYILQGKGNKGKNKQMGLHQIKKLLHP